VTQLHRVADGEDDIASEKFVALLAYEPLVDLTGRVGSHIELRREIREAVGIVVDKSDAIYSHTELEGRGVDESIVQVIAEWR